MCGCGAKYRPPSSNSTALPTVPRPKKSRAVEEEITAAIPAPSVRKRRSGYIPRPPKRR